ncbi:HIT family protein [Mangrovibrevibacter kandeliae]|uniref:HIT family protein n=1 Tax=Mangrovibrevibacter kandeliae TaxID=2968473 RepID=UPI002118129A|nr:HIT family protein [Aurantimonas sp. CSK15Z-1]MCQ8782560.1 HIT family protein [Aurantimonas sp. CSK15Z-1]
MAYDESNIFAKILREEIPSHRVYQDESCIAIMDVMPQSKGHCLVVPRAPSRNLLDCADATLGAVMPVVARLARAVKTAFHADGVMISQFNEAAAGQTVYHLHFHVIPRYDGVPLQPHSGGMADQAMLAEQADMIRAALG